MSESSDSTSERLATPAFFEDEELFSSGASSHSDNAQNTKDSNSLGAGLLKAVQSDAQRTLVQAEVNEHPTQVTMIEGEDDDSVLSQIESPELAKLAKFVKAEKAGEVLPALKSSSSTPNAPGKGKAKTSRSLQEPMPTRCSRRKRGRTPSNDGLDMDAPPRRRGKYSQVVG